MKPSDLQTDIERLEVTLQEVQRELAEMRARAAARKTLRFGVVREAEEIPKQPSVPPPPASVSQVKSRVEDGKPRRTLSDAGRYEVVSTDARRR